MDSNSEGFEAFRFLIGGTWRGVFPDGKTIDCHRFEWVYEEQFIRDTHVVYGEGEPYRGEAIYAWDPQREQVIFWYWNNTGGFSEGAFEIRAGELRSSEHYTAADTMELKSVWERLGEDEYKTRTYALREGDWQPLWSVLYRRQVEDQDGAASSVQGDKQIDNGQISH